MLPMQGGCWLCQSPLKFTSQGLCSYCARPAAAAALLSALRAARQQFPRRLRALPAPSAAVATSGGGH